MKPDVKKKLISRESIHQYKTSNEISLILKK